MTESKIHVFTPSMDGEYVPIKFTSRAKDLKDTEVFIFLDEETRHIYIWTGENSSVRKRFISSQIARQMRLEKGMTHRISTEDQGNETAKFQEFMERLEQSPVTISTPLEVTPPIEAASIPETTPTPKTTKPKPTKSVSETTKAEKVLKPVSPPPPPPSETKKVKADKPIEMKEDEESSILYFAADESVEVTESKAKLLYSATNNETTLTMLHTSSATSEGKIALFSLKRNTKTATCKTAKPIFVIYLSSRMNSVQALDDLEIPIPAGYSIYYTCPENTFLGINLE